MEKYWYDAIVKEVYDGDTVTIDIDLGFNTWTMNQKFRLYGVDAPEIRGETKENGIISRDALRNQVLNQQVIIHTIKDRKDKYGRWLCEIYKGALNINQWMIDNGYASIYIESV